MFAAIHWVRPNGTPTQAAEIQTDRAAMDLYPILPSVGFVGIGRGTDFTTGVRDVVYTFDVEDFAIADLIRDHLAVAAAVGQHPAAGTMTVVKEA